MKALFIGAHNDELEYCCGGMAYLLGQRGFELHFANLANKRREYKKHNGRTDSFRDPAACAEYDRQDIAAAEIFGAKLHVVGGYSDGFFVVNDENLKLVRDVVEEVMPDIAFIHWMRDSHWEHIQASRAAFQILCEYARCEVHAFEAGPWQSMNYMSPDFIIDITPAMETIDRSLIIFDQPLAGGPGLVREKRIAAQYRGYMAGFEYGEAYKILRYPPASKGVELMLPKLLGSAYRWGGGDQYPMGLQYFV